MLLKNCLAVFRLVNGEKYKIIIITTTTTTTTTRTTTTSYRKHPYWALNTSGSTNAKVQNI